MDFKEDTIGDILASEHEMILHGAENYGEYFINASEFNNLLQKFIKSINDPTKYIALAFIFQIHKYHTLAFLSATRRHHIQANMNLRYAIEAGQWASYAMGNKEENKFFEKDKNGTAYVENKHKKEMYAWLDENFKIKSEEAKRLKKIISDSSVHSDVVYAFQNFHVDTADNFSFKTTFFDKKDEYLVKTDLWFVANIALGLLDLFYGVNKKYIVFKFIDDFDIEFKKLVTQNNKLKKEMMNTERFKKALNLNPENK